MKFYPKKKALVTTEADLLFPYLAPYADKMRLQDRDRHFSACPLRGNVAGIDGGDYVGSQTAIASPFSLLFKILPASGPKLKSTSIAPAQTWHPRKGCRLTKSFLRMVFPVASLYSDTAEF